MNRVLVHRACAALISTLLATAAVTAAAQNRLVNMTPQARSGEVSQDAEPTLAIDPNDYSRMAGSAFTWDNLTGSSATPWSMTGSTAPIYVSTDRGATWTLVFTVPSAAGNHPPTSDITMAFGSTLSGAPAHTTSWLYAGVLPEPTASMTVYRARDFLDGTTVMTGLSTPSALLTDQPHTTALTELHLGQDRVYVGFNNGYNCEAVNGRSSTLDASQSASIASPTFGLDVIEARNASCQDGYAQVVAAHLDGTIYAAFIHDLGGSPKLVVVRDDNWASGATPFTALTDPSDSTAGRYATGVLSAPSGFEQLQRLGWSNLKIAVDPTNSSRVYVAYGDGAAINSETIHVIRSTDRGQHWSGDLLTVTNAVNPEIAINAYGTVGVLYQQVVGSRWQVFLRRTTDADASIFDSPGLLLANTDATTPSRQFNPYLGDYSSLRAAGKNFFGIFSASNYPDTANFLPGVVYNRYVNWGAHTLYADAAMTTAAVVSIDPFFFEADAVTPDNDFYVRDWTNDATHADNGVEPSTNPVFYATSDVWNRRSPSPGTFSSDQPQNEDAGNGAGLIGDNWAFVRVRRNVTGAAASVTAHFLVSKFGTGSNYVDSTVSDPDVSFPDPDPVIAADTSAGAWISAAYHWHLNAISGNHLCLAVEISAPGSNYVPPSLVGEAPGWSSGTDLRIVSDNHKAQRNMQLSTTPAMPGGSPGGGSIQYAIVHNPGVEVRDMTLRVAVPEASRRYVREAVVHDVDPERRQASAAKPGEIMTLKAMRPGENRWVAIEIETAGLREGETAQVFVDELAGATPVNGFGVGVTGAPLSVAIRDTLRDYRMLSERLGAGFGAKTSASSAKTAEASAPAAYAAYVKGVMLPSLAKDLGAAGALGPSDPFHLDQLLAAAKAEAAPERLVTDVNSILNAADSRLTSLQLDKGDPADVLQMVRLQAHVFRTHPELSKLECASRVAEASEAFVRGRGLKTSLSAAYPKHLAEVEKCLGEAATRRGAPAPKFDAIDVASLEKAHRATLLALLP